MYIKKKVSTELKKNYKFPHPCILPPIPLKENKTK